MKVPALDQSIVAVVGLGYVGLPLAVAFGRRLTTIGFDISQRRIAELRAGHERTGEVDPADLDVPLLTFTDDPADLARATTYIVTVPTPIDEVRNPDLSPLRGACELLAPRLRPGAVVVFESTVYPGATEEYCVPLLEAGSGLRVNVDFSVGYSPERINPGDKQHRLHNITKITSGSNPDAARYVDALYQLVVTDAPTYPAESIRVAEAAKVIENTQRDLNIALVNELAVIFGRLGIDTHAVLAAAGTKWNFLPFTPGLVGGHCISVDPYYLTHKAQSIGYNPEVILAGRRINDRMGLHIAAVLVKMMLQRGMHVARSRVLVLGLAFKENCPDLRNTRVVDIIAELRDHGVTVDVHDPEVDADEARHEYGLELIDAPADGSYDAIVLAVPHAGFVHAGAARIRRWGRDGAVLYDVKSALPRAEVDGRL